MKYKIYRLVIKIILLNRKFIYIYKYFLKISEKILIYCLTKLYQLYFNIIYIYIYVIST